MGQYGVVSRRSRPLSRDLRVIQPTGSPEQLWPQIEPFLPRAEKIHFAGGEPLLMEGHYQTLERMKKLGQLDVGLQYNTNLTVLEACGRNVLDLWSEFSSIRLMVSFDGAGARGEYIRSGLHWETVVENWRSVRSRCPHVELIIHFTLSLLNVLHLPDFYDECTELGMIQSQGMLINLVLVPEHLCITTLPRELEEQAEARLLSRMDKFPDDEAGRLMRARFQEVVDFLKAPDTSHLLPKFREHTFGLDQLRKESFPRVFPELASLAVTPDGSPAWDVALSEVGSRSD